VARAGDALGSASSGGGGGDRPRARPASAS
jgi:hypothetical protein